MTTIETLKQWFSNLKKPTQEQFWAWLDSFWHKSEKIPMESVEGLDKLVEGTASAEQLNNHLNDSNAHKVLFDKKVDKVEGKELSSNDFTNDYKQKLDTLHPTDISKLLPKGNFTGTAQDLKKQIDDKADKNHKHKWSEIEEKPSIPSEENFWKSNIGEIEISNENKGGRQSGSYNFYGGQGILLSFRGGGNITSLEICKKSLNKYVNHRLLVRASDENNEFPNEGEWEELAWYSDTKRLGYIAFEYRPIEPGTTYGISASEEGNFGKMLYIESPCYIDVDHLKDTLACLQYFKTFDEGEITLRSIRREVELVYLTEDTICNGKTGSRIYLYACKNKVYIEIINLK
jgi:hypothetical protein|nr:MAG TPA: hypothetical protein [Caudoviricetes sp.]